MCGKVIKSSSRQVEGYKVKAIFGGSKLHLHFPCLPGVLVKIDEPDPLWRDFVYDLLFGLHVFCNSWDDAIVQLFKFECLFTGDFMCFALVLERSPSIPPDNERYSWIFFEIRDFS
jgi:hypothetical protein